MGAAQGSNTLVLRLSASIIGAAAGAALLMILVGLGDSLVADIAPSGETSLDDLLINAGLWPLRWAQAAVLPVFLAAGALVGLRAAAWLVPAPPSFRPCATCSFEDTCWCRRFHEAGRLAACRTPSSPAATGRRPLTTWSGRTPSPRR
jgi:hypothetical protein